MKSKKIMIGIAIALLIITVFFVLVYVGLYWAFNSDPSTKIKEGFSDELLYSLKAEYGVTIPEDAVFIEGVNTNGWQDPYVIVLFELPYAENAALGDHDAFIHSALSLNREQYGNSAVYSIVSEGFEDLGGKMQYEIDFTGKSFTSISYKIEENKIIVRFLGWRPGHNYP